MSLDFCAATADNDEQGGALTSYAAQFVRLEECEEALFDNWRKIQIKRSNLTATIENHCETSTRDS